VTHTPHAPHTGCNHEAEIIALRLVLAVARNDWDAQVAVCKQMSGHRPEDIVKELACIATDFARFLGGDSHAGGVRVIEQWMQLVLDDIDEEAN
jgi:hypothetical protein